MAVGSRAARGGEGAAYHYPFEEERALRQALIAGDVERAHAASRVVLALLLAEDRDLARLRSDAIHLAVVIVRKCLQAGLGVGELLADTATWTAAILRAEHASGVVGELNGLVDRVLAVAGAERQRSRRRVAEMARRYVDSHYQKNVTLQEVAGIVNLSYSYLSRVFTQEIGISFQRYLARVRVAAAQELLCTTSLRIEEVGALVGYGDASHFIRVFKGHVGVTPGRFGRDRDPRCG